MDAGGKYRPIMQPDQATFPDETPLEKGVKYTDNAMIMAHRAAEAGLTTLKYSGTWKA